MKEKTSCFKDEKIQGVIAGVQEEKSTPEVIRVEPPCRLASSTWIRILMPGSSLSAYLKQYNLEKRFQPTFSPIPGTEESLNSEYIETLTKNKY